MKKFKKLICRYFGHKWVISMVTRSRTIGFGNCMRCGCKGRDIEEVTS